MQIRTVKKTTVNSYRNFIEMHREKVFRIITVGVADEKTALTLTEDVFINYYKTINSTDSIPSVSKLYRKAYNYAEEYASTHRGELQKIVLDFTRDAFFAAGGQVHDFKGKSLEIEKDIKISLTMLPDEQRKVVELRDVHGFELEEISAITGISDGVIKSRLNLGRNGMKSILMKKWNI